MPIEIPSIRSLSTFAGTLLSQIPFLSSNLPQSQQPLTSPYTPFGNAPSCPIDSPTSCQNSTVAPDSCCFIYPGGQLLQTQFWDTNPTVGPVDSWTLHGLWSIPVFFSVYIPIAPQTPSRKEIERHLLTRRKPGPTFATAPTPHTVPQPPKHTPSPPSSHAAPPSCSPTWRSTGSPTRAPWSIFGNTSLTSMRRASIRWRRAVMGRRISKGMKWWISLQRRRKFLRYVMGCIFWSLVLFVVRISGGVDVDVNVEGFGMSLHLDVDLQGQRT